VAHLVSRSDAVRSNGTRLPILLSMTCLSGSFANPTLSAIDEELLRQPHGGIVAAFSPTGSGVNTGHTAILTGMLPVLARGETLGAAHLAGLQADDKQRQTIEEIGRFALATRNCAPGHSSGALR
jgi:hypothetical protein